MIYQDINIEHFGNDVFRLEAAGIVLYLDPYNLKPDQVKMADYVLVTHEHFDHLSPNDIKKVIGQESVIIASAQCQGKLSGLKVKEIIYVAPNQQLELVDIEVATIPSYNLNKFRSQGLPYHPKDDGQVGYVITLSGVRIYHAGDTDNIPEMAQLKNIDVALLPVSGTYVMTPKEAVEATRIIKPRLVIPMHYGSVVGSLNEAREFKQEILNNPDLANISVEIV